MNYRKLAEAKIINHNVAEVGILLRNNNVDRYLARISSKYPSKNTDFATIFILKYIFILNTCKKLC